MTDGLLGAVQFLTRVPIRLDRPVPHDRVLPWFPIVGAAIGLVVGGTAAVLGEVVPIPVAATVAVVIGLLLTGAFHEDGLADVADAFGGGWTRDQRLEILKDSRHGTYGVAALASSIAVRAVAAGSIADPAAVVAAFVAAHTLGRASAVVALRSAPAARESGLGVDAATSLRLAPTLAGLTAGLVVVVATSGWWAAPFVLAAAIGTTATVVLAVRKIGGLAGDVLGAVEQVVECLVLVVASGLAAHSTIWWA